MPQYVDPTFAHSVLGVPGRMTHQTVKPGQAPGLWFKQCWISEARSIAGYSKGAKITVEIRFDDELGNRHNTFAITATVESPASWRGRDIEAGGCLHDDIARVFPELAPLLRWHLTSSDGPMHYVANAVYHAGDRDHRGLRKGETRPLIGRDGQPCWTLVAVRAEGVAISDTPTGREYTGADVYPLFILAKAFKGSTPPAAPVLEWRQDMVTGEGKARDLAAARSCAVWPDATDAELSAEPDELRAALAARLPALLTDFRAAVEGAGFAWQPAV